jgi:hypothetical protein
MEICEITRPAIVARMISTRTISFRVLPLRRGVVLFKRRLRFGEDARRANGGPR